ncbi:hypothetical protein NDU88_004489 [Pleurodeles waltl]|uniref:Uncharacterized protein n=1 Tax=Pleurodeles waltl TaxID=8319 RepID=A0AAV7W8A1_PLEWA|nr:hypothetical protein NDU88_004489 [Pleurodeles waltl]
MFIFSLRPLELRPRLLLNPCSACKRDPTGGVLGSRVASSRRSSLFKEHRAVLGAWGDFPAGVVSPRSAVLPPGSLLCFNDAGSEDPVSAGGPAAAGKLPDLLRRWRHVTDLGPGDCSGRPETRGFNRRSSPARNNPHPCERAEMFTLNEDVGALYRG